MSGTSRPSRGWCSRSGATGTTGGLTNYLVDCGCVRVTEGAGAARAGDVTHDGGKLFPRGKSIIESVNLIEHMSAVLSAARDRGIRVFYVPHHRPVEGDYTTWRFLSASQRGVRDTKTFGKGTWGGEFRPDLAPCAADLVAAEHWGASGFANTDLDLLLKQHAVSRVVFTGMRADTCVDTSARFAQELGITPRC